MIRSAWASFLAGSDKASSTDAYKLSDILRESLDSPIPHDPSVGWSPYSDRGHQLPVARLSRQQDTTLADLGEYHAGDELSELLSPATFAFARMLGAKRGRNGTSPATGGPLVDVLSVPQYYNIDPSLSPRSEPIDIPRVNQKYTLDEYEQRSLPVLEPLHRANEWRQEVVLSRALGLVSADAEPSSKTAIYQTLHDTPIGSTTAVKVIRTWQGTTAVGSLDTPRLPPPSFLEQFASIQEDAALSVTSEGSEDTSDTESLTSCPTTQSLISDDDTTEKTSIGRTQQSRVAKSDASKSSEGSLRVTPDLLCLLQHDPSQAQADLLDYQAVFRKIRGDMDADPRSTRQRLQQLTASLNQKLSTVEDLKSFWECPAMNITKLASCIVYDQSRVFK